MIAIKSKKNSLAARGQKATMSQTVTIATRTDAAACRDQRKETAH